jgi:hypothetical protein
MGATAATILSEVCKAWIQYLFASDDEESEAWGREGTLLARATFVKAGSDVRQR